MYTNIFTKINNLDNLTNSEVKLVKFISDHPEEFVNLKPKEIAAKTYISIPTIYRLINKLGISGINDFKLEIKSALTNKDNANIDDFNFPILPTDSQYEVMLRLKDVYFQTINDTIDLSNPNSLVNATILLEKAKTISIFTSAGNIFFALNFKFQMQEIGIEINVPTEEYSQRLTATNCSDNDLAIVISFGGRGMNAEKICKILKNNNTSILLITSTIPNKLNKYANTTIYMSSYEEHYNKISSFSTRLTLLFILDTLYANYFRRNYDKNYKLKIQKYNALSLK
ncbi:MAG: MurR/RpiR family transcriptional regulator [Erysipelotrichaceae bacterium]|nr:MurR/RpiR family transcriptional regulator [Erysipelotrichaceae bacterium]